MLLYENVNETMFHFLKTQAEIKTQLPALFRQITSLNEQCGHYTDSKKYCKPFC